MRQLKESALCKQLMGPDQITPLNIDLCEQAYLASRGDGDARAVNVSALQKTLRDQGAFL